MISTDQMIAVRGAGDIATGAALRLWRCGFKVVLSELAQPLCVRRTVSFANAVYEGQMTVEGVECKRVDSLAETEALWQCGKIPLWIDPAGEEILAFRPDVLVDGRMLKSYQEHSNLSEAVLVIGLGPGFCAGRNAHAVVETNRGHNLGRVLWQGEAEPDTGTPGLIQGETGRRVVKAPLAGVFYPFAGIGDQVQSGELIAKVDETPIYAGLSGMVRGAIYPGLSVAEGLKLMDIDPRGKKAYCFSVSDKANAVGGGVLEAILTWNARRSAAR